MKRGAAAAVAALVCVSCRIFDPLACSAKAEPAVIVTIVDSVTGVPRAAEARAEARAPAFVDTLRAGHTNGSGVLLTRQGVDERPGIYDVIVQAPGYAEWRQSGVIARPGECHVQTAELEARLRAVSSARAEPWPRDPHSIYPHSIGSPA